MWSGVGRAGALAYCALYLSVPTRLPREEKTKGAGEKLFREMDEVKQSYVRVSGKLLKEITISFFK